MLNFWYLCEVKSLKKKRSRWHKMDFEYRFKSLLPLGVPQCYNSFVECKPYQLTHITEDLGSDLLAESYLIYHVRYFSLPDIARKPFIDDKPDDFDYFAYAVSRLSDLGLTELAIDMLRQQQDAGFSIASPSFRL